MRRPTLMIAVGMPGPHGNDDDEDSLQREHEGDDADVASEAIISIVNHLKDNKASAVRDIRAFTAALEDLCQAFMDKDYHAVGDAADAARDALHSLIS